MPEIHYKGIRFQNGYAYRNCEIPLEQQGLVLVRGLNLDDGGFLGAGKTSPFEVFSLLQTGKVGKQRKGERILADDVINLSVGDGFEARLRFDIDGRPYEIVQCRRHPRFGNAYRIVDVNSGRNILPDQNRKFPHQWVLKEILGLDEKSFFNLVYMAQDFSNVMLHGTDTDRQQSLIQMFGLDVYDHLLKRTKQKLSALMVTARDVVQLQEELTEITTELQQYTETPEHVLTDLEIKRQQRRNLQDQHDAALDQQDDLQIKLRGLEMRKRYISEIKAAWATLPSPPIKDVRKADEALVDKIKQQVDETNNNILNLRNSIRLIDQRHIIEQRLATITSCDEDETEQQLNSTRDELRRLTNKELPRAERRLELMQDLRKLQKPLRRTNQILEELEAAQDLRRTTEQEIKAIKAALETDVCPTCGRPYGDGECDADDYRKRLQQHQADLKTHASDVHSLSAELKNAEEYDELRKRLEQIGPSASTTDIQKEIGRLTREERRLVGLLESERLRETLQAQLDTLPQEPVQALRKQQRIEEQKLERLQQQHSVVSRVVENLNQLNQLPQGKLSAVKQRLIEASRTLRETNGEIVLLGDDIAALERTHEKLSTLTERKIKIELGIKKTEKVQTEIRCLQALEKVFGSKGLKRERFISILADAAEQTVPHYTHLLWPRHNIRLALAESAGDAVKFELHRGDLVTSSRMLSGGERNKAGLSLLFGMRDLKEKYTGLSTNVLILDEPFGNLDAYGTDCLLNVLLDLKSRFETILVIGNQQDVLTHAAWDQVWWAVRQNNEATLYRDGLPERYRLDVERYAGQINSQL